MSTSPFLLVIFFFLFCLLLSTAGVHLIKCHAVYFRSTMIPLCFSSLSHSPFSHIACNPRAIVFHSIFLSSFTQIGAEGKHTGSAKLVINARDNICALAWPFKGCSFYFSPLGFSRERKEKKNRRGKEARGRYESKTPVVGYCCHGRF